MLCSLLPVFALLIPPGTAGLGSPTHPFGPPAPEPIASPWMGPVPGLIGPAMLPAAPRVAAGAAVQVATYGSTGADGALVVPAGTIRVINLANEGTYDPTNWVVRFDYTSIDIQAGAEVRFLNHPSRAPVAWIVQGDVDIGAGAIVNLNGANGTTASQPGYAEPGPGGFRGGRNSATGIADEGSGGFGFGGAKGDATDFSYQGSGGSYRLSGGTGWGASGSQIGPTYGGPAIFQLIGGSGGGGGRDAGSWISSTGGGAGGGALLIATDGALLIQGTLTAGGGFSVAAPGGQSGLGGSGGALRIASLVGVTLSTSSQLQANGLTGGGAGRVRIEAPGGLPDISGSVPALTSFGEPQPAFRSQPPRVWISSIGGIATPPDGVLKAGLGFAGEEADMLLIDPGAVDIVVETANLPEGSQVYLRIGRAKVHANILGPLTLGFGSSVTFTSVNLSSGFAALQVRAVLPQN